MSTENGETGPRQPSAADQEALGKAMSRLEIASGVNKKKEDTTKSQAKKEVEVKKKIKIAAEDVSFLVRGCSYRSGCRACAVDVTDVWNRSTSLTFRRTRPPSC
jgi:hypothetical protein